MNKKDLIKLIKNKDTKFAEVFKKLSEYFNEDKECEQLFLDLSDSIEDIHYFYEYYISLHYSDYNMSKRIAFQKTRDRLSNRFKPLEQWQKSKTFVHY